LNKKHVVFGQVSSGYDIVECIAKGGGSDGKIVKNFAKITKCGVVEKR
jgi:cyclophilin family peptidyl-prolyl cis-trans isomerase